MMKKSLALFLLVLGAAVFAETENLVDENLPTQTKKVNTAVSLKPKFGTIWGYDFNTGNTGFREIIDIDMEWEMLSYMDHATDVEDIDYGLPYGMAMFSGGHFTLKLQNEDGDMSSSDGNGGTTLVPLWSINYEKLWGKIIWDPFYLLVAANENNFFTRPTGWSFATANSRPRANWAHIGNRVQNWLGILNPTTKWMLTGKNDQLSTQGGGAGLGLGYIGGASEVLVQVASDSDWVSNKDNKYEFGASVESNPVGNLMVRGSAVYGVNYVNVAPFGFAGSLGYRFDVTNTVAIMPHTAMDFKFLGKSDDPTSLYATENSFGFDVIWPGANGWGDNPLINQETNIFAGLTVDGSVYKLKDQEPVINAQVSLHEDDAGGLIPNLGTTFVVDLANVMEGTFAYAYGVYVDYLLWNQFKPYTRVFHTYMNPADLRTDQVLQTEIGMEITVIPHSVITVKYESPDLSRYEDNKGLFTTSVMVTF